MRSLLLCAEVTTAYRGHHSVQRSSQRTSWGHQFSPRGLTFTWWGCYGLCSQHKPKEASPLLFILFLCLFLSYGPFTCILFHRFSRQLSAFSLCSSGLLSALLVLSTVCLFLKVSQCGSPQWRAADAEIKVPSGENTELEGSPFKDYGMSVYSHTCYANCQGFLPC